MPVADLELVLLSQTNISIPINSAHGLDDLPGLASVAAGVHGERTADRAGNSSEELCACELVKRSEPRHLGGGDTRTGVDEAFLHFRPQPRRMQGNHGAAKPAVADEQIRAQTDKEDG